MVNLSHAITLTFTSVSAAILAGAHSIQVIPHQLTYAMSFIVAYLFAVSLSTKSWEPAAVSMLLVILSAIGFIVV